MTKVRCDLWCKHQVKGVCSKTEISIKEMQYFEERTTPDCYDFDSTKGQCYCCEHCNIDVNICEFDGHKVDEGSTCTTCEFSSVYQKVRESDD